MSSASRRWPAWIVIALCLALLVVVRNGRLPAATVTSWLQPSADSAGRSGAADPEGAVEHREDELWVCADPNNLPFSNDRLQGFENRIAELVARDLGKTVRYFWRPQRRGFVRTTLRAEACDLIVGIPASFDPVETTIPYYRSTYVFVTRANRPPVQSFDDPRLRRMLIGIQLTGDDYDNPPPAQALARRRLAGQVRGYTVYGDYSRPSPQRSIVDDVATGRIDTAIVWGPTAGYFAAMARERLSIVPVKAAGEPRTLRFAFDIVMGVRRGDRELLDRLNRIHRKRRTAIEAVLREFHVPLLRPAGTS
jgi:mxaJ protein